MKKFRIVQIVHNVGSLKEKDPRSKIEYVIERKNWLGKWKEIFNVEEARVSRISHSTFEDAEAYMIANYTGHGVLERTGWEYTYEPYTYGF
jgi:hypothetical protein